MSQNHIEPAGAQPIWPLALNSGGDLALGQGPGQRSYSGLPAVGALDLASLWRIGLEWRWLILGAIAVALAGAVVITFLTTPLYRASATIEINPPTVEILDEGKTGTKTAAGDLAYLSTQYGLLASKSLAQRVAQELNLASNEDFAAPGADPARRLKSATGILSRNFEVDPIQGSRLV